MNKYKVQITKTYCIDLEADKNDQELLTRAENVLDEMMLRGQEHFVQTEDTDFVVFDVTNTDDQFDPLD